MPGYDRTGPAGMGPMTGWGRGLCNPRGGRIGRRAFGPRFGWGGFGRGWRHRVWAADSPEWDWRGFPGRRGPYSEPSYTRDEEMAVLKEEAAGLKEELQAIEQRLSELEAGSAKAK